MRGQRGEPGRWDETRFSLVAIRAVVPVGFEFVFTFSKCADRTHRRPILFDRQISSFGISSAPFFLSLSLFSPKKKKKKEKTNTVSPQFAKWIRAEIYLSDDIYPRMS